MKVSCLKSLFPLIAFLICNIFNLTAQNPQRSHSHEAQLERLVPSIPYLVYDSDSLSGFDENSALATASAEGFSEENTARYLHLQKRNYIKSKYAINAISNFKQNPPTPQAACTNMDFETGTTTGWTTSGDAVIRSGAATDPYGGFPVVCPGGAFSLQLGNPTNVTTSIARQTFAVTPANAYFVLKFAMVILNFPHGPTEAARVFIRFKDGAGNIIACPNLECYYANGSSYGLTSGFQTGANGVNIGAQSYPTTYVPWTNLGFDLTPYIGQNMTVEVENRWCVYNYDWAYCYIDGLCSTLTTSVTGGCAGSSTGTLTAPPAMDNYAWAGPAGSSVSSITTQTATTTTPGIYTVTCTPYSSCGTATYVYTLNFSPTGAPTANFNYTVAPCASSFSVPVIDMSSPNSGGPISTWTWDWGDGSPFGSGSSGSHTYATGGTKTIELKVSNGSCLDSISKTFVFTPGANAGFNVNNSCLGSPSNFTSTSTPSASIVAYDWNYGEGPNGNGVNSSHTYLTPGVKTITLTVTSAGGCTNTAVKSLTISPNPVVAFTTNTVCLGVATAFTDNSTVSAPDVVSGWSWDFDNNGTSDNGTQSPTFTYPTSGTVTAVLTASTSSGCTGSVSATVKVNALPTATFTPVNACLNNNVVLNNTSSVPAPDNIANYSWNFGVGASPATASGITANPTPLVYSSSGPKTIVLNITANTSCTASITQTVEVYPQPVANFSTTSVCQGTATAFTDLSTTAVGTITGWQWDYTHDGTNDNSTQNPNNTYSPSGTYTAQLIATTSNGCKDTILLPVNVWGHAVPDFTVTTVCFNVATNFTNLTTTTLNPNTGGVPGYSWDFGDSSPADATTSPSHTYTSSITGATFNASLTVTTTNGCVDMVSRLVKINALPTATFTPVNACLNNNVVLNNTSSIALPDNLSGYSWNFGAGAVPSLTSSVQNPGTLSYNTSGPKTITLIVTANTSCTASITQTVDIYPQPVAGFSTTSVCQSTATAYTDLSTTSTGTVTGWQWDFTNNNSIDNSTQNPSTTFTASGTFTTNLIVTTSNGCKDTIALPVNVWGHAVPDFTATTVCFNYTTNFGNLTNNAANPNTGGAPNYTWNFGDGSPTDATTSPAHTYTSSINGATFNASLTVTTTNGCVDSVTKVVKINALPTATFTPVNACMNSNVLLNNSSSIGLPDNINIYNWDFGANATPLTSAAQNPPSLSYSTSGIKTITLSITANTTCTATITQTVEIYPQPVANFSTTSVCQSTATAFTDLSTTTVGTITGWAWDFTNNGGPADATIQNPTNIFATSGTFTTSLVATSSNGCKDTVKIGVDVWGHTIPDFSPDNVCFGTATTFTNQTSETINQNTGTPSTYTWNFADGSGINNQNNPVHTYTLGGNANATYNVTLTATSFHGCADSVVKVVKVFAVPTASFTADSVCLGSPSHLTDASNGNGNVIGTFDWDFTGDGSPEATATANPNYTFPNFGSNPVSYTVSTNPVAGLTCRNVISTLTVWVNPNPAPAFSFSNACVNAQPNTFDASSSTIAIGTNTAYAWSYGDAATGTFTVPTTSHTYLLAQAYNVTLTVTSNKGCMTSTSQQVTVYPKPAGHFTYTPTCDSKQMTLSAITDAGSGTIAGWNWDMNNSITSFEKTTQVITYTFPAPSAGTQSVALVLVTDHQCRDTVHQTVYIDYVPVPDFKVDDPDGCPEHCVTFTDLTPPVTGPGQNTDWKWVFGDGTELHAANNGQQPHCYNNTTSNQVNTFGVKLVVTTDRGCTDSISKASFITVYPTPIAGYDVAPNPGNVVTPLIYFTNQSIDYTKWWWSFGDGPQLDSVNVDPTHFYGSETAENYQSVLIVENQYGCRDEARVLVEIQPEFTFYIPNAFTPANNDNINDVFTGKGIGIEHYEMWIFDRWGAMIFYTDDITKGWNGKVQGKSQEVQQDVYIWKVKVKDVLGKKHDYLGHVTLLR